MNFKRNSSVHKDIIEQHFADYRLRNLFLRPQHISTFTWSEDEGILHGFLNSDRYSTNTLFLVHNDNLSELTKELEQRIIDICDKRIDMDAAAYIAVWGDSGVEHSLVMGSVSCFSGRWKDHIATPCLRIRDDAPFYIDDILEEIELSLSHGINVSNDVFTLLGMNTSGIEDATNYVEHIKQIANEWNYEDTFDDERSGSRVLQAIDFWVADIENKHIHEQITSTGKAKRKKVI